MTTATMSLHQNNDGTVIIEEITPKRAAQLLEANTGNFRTLEMKRCHRYAKDMKNGRWELTGDSIKIANNIVVDGQHRLMAIVLSGVSTRTVVTYNLPGSPHAIDRGKPRTVGQWLQHKHFKNANLVAATAKLALQHQEGRWAQKQLQTETFTDADVINYAVKHKKELEAATAYTRGLASKLATKSTVSALIHIGSGQDEKPEENPIIEFFWSGIQTGENLLSKEPCLTMRNRLIQASIGYHKLDKFMERMLLTIAWNKTVLSEEWGVCRLRMSGPSAQTPPNTILIAD